MILVVLVLLKNVGDCGTKEVLVLEKREARGVARGVAPTLAAIFSCWSVFCEGGGRRRLKKKKERNVAVDLIFLKLARDGVRWT